MINAYLMWAVGGHMLTELNLELRKIRSVRRHVREIYQEWSHMNWT